MGLTTSRLALPYPVSTDPNNVPSDMLALGARLDLIGASYAAGVASARPAAGTQGRFYLATDTKVVSFDTGTAWVDMNPAALLTTKGDLVVASASGVASRLGVGTNSQALVSRATAPNGVSWESQLGMPIGLLGAVAPTRHVGGTTSGPPVAGAFLAGDFVTSANGTVSICTVGGTSGTWITLERPTAPPAEQLCVVSRNVDQYHPTDTFMAVFFTTASVKGSGVYSLSGTTLTVLLAGWYQFHGQVQWDYTPNNFRQILLYGNGGTNQWAGAGFAAGGGDIGTTGAGHFPGGNVNVMTYAAANDTFQLVGWQNNGAAINMKADQLGLRMSVRYLGS